MSNTAMVKFTRGSWRAYFGHSRNIPISTPTGAVALCMGGRMAGGYVEAVSREEAEANAHLIAAAPEMFYALEELLSFVNRTADAYWKTSYAKAIKNADAALDRARGEAESVCPTKVRP